MFFDDTLWQQQRGLKSHRRQSLDCSNAAYDKPGLKDISHWHPHVLPARVTFLRSESPRPLFGLRSGTPLLALLDRRIARLEVEAVLKDAAAMKKIRKGKYAQEKGRKTVTRDVTAARIGGGGLTTKNQFVDGPRRKE